MSVKFSVMITGMYPMDAYVGWAQKIEHYGFDELHIADDLIFRPAWPILTLIGANTSRIRLGPAIVTPQVAHPAYHAANLVALDELTGGRAICGVGRGGFNPMLGITNPKKPIKMLREAHELMQRMISGSREPYEGEFFSATSDLFFQFDVLRRDIPVFIGTWGPQMAMMAGKVASGFKADCTWSPSYLAHLRDQFFKGAEAENRDPSKLDVIVGPLCSLSRDRDAAIDHIKGMLALLQPMLAPMPANEGIPEDEIQGAFEAFQAGDVEKAKSMVSDRAVRAFSVSGTAADAIPQIEEMLAAGATHIAFGPPLGPDFDEALDIIAKDILPHFSKLREH
ncbi:LLM class flavin-dependent oxidoreductase [Kineobactrum salinum]|uniref:LLM class flavin-dependent oxidoreductase n=1 Tax=Kineobactrum salinum TaxID=2708301 RepID=A0A6C0U5C9_9GAMM|nr:LLM class flavin-dependent oxidoreductase [Kineobactrum salinum]QIB67321.1 LLM class flavin-dependent oxidoreductase [Kineobactrum salinum]